LNSIFIIGSFYDRCMFKTVFNVLFPHSPAHSLFGLHVTQEEIRSIHTYAHKDIGIDGLPYEIISAVAYRHAPLLQRAMFTIKYRRDPYLIGDMASLLFDVIKEELRPGMVLCPVPLHWKRFLDRGFNQSVYIAEHLSEKTKLPMSHLLRRKRDTGHQAWRSREERLHAMHDAFILKKIQNVPRHVVLIDDITTTGSTLHECAKVLNNAGIERIDAWVIAHG